MCALRIVIFEDEPIVMAGLCSIINSQNHGWTVVGTADNGQEGLKVIRELKPDVILTDIRMPYVDGLELIKRVRQQDEDVVIIILTGHADFNYAQLAVKYGVFDYILKPSSPKEIISILEKAESAIMKLNRNSSRNEAETNRDPVMVMMKRLIYETKFFESMESKDVNNAVCKFMDEAGRCGIWGLEFKKAVKIVERAASEILTKLSEDRLLTLCNLVQSKQQLTGVYTTQNVAELQKFSSDFISILTGMVTQNSAKNVLILKAIEYMNEDMFRDISLKDVADRLFLNYSYFSQLFKKEMGMTFSDFLIYIRMEKAKELLSDVTSKTYEVAFKVGYNNPKHFSSSFKRIYGLSPSEYRNIFFE